MTSKQTINSLERALSILEYFGPDVRTASMSALSEDLGIPLASAYRIVRTLERRGYLRRDEATRELTLGLSLVHLGRLVTEQLDVRAAARPVMERLAESGGETAVLLIPHRHKAVCVEIIEGTSPIRPRSILLGETHHYNAGAIPMALLAGLSPDEIEEVLGGPLPSLAPRTITDPDVLRARLKEIQAAGYAYSRDEMIEGTAAVGVPILASSAGYAVAALGLTGIAKRIAGLERLVLDATAEIEAALGGGGRRREEDPQHASSA